MSIDNCDHGDYIVVYEVLRKNQCPVCTLTEELEEATERITALATEVEDLQQQIEPE